MKIDDDAPFREGVVLNRPVKVGGGSFVNAGMRKEVRIDKALKPGLRVTVKLGEKTGMCSFEHFKFTLSAIIKAMFSLETRERNCVLMRAPAIMLESAKAMTSFAKESNGLTSTKALVSLQLGEHAL